LKRKEKAAGLGEPKQGKAIKNECARRGKKKKSGVTKLEGEDHWSMG